MKNFSQLIGSLSHDQHAVDTLARLVFACRYRTADPRLTTHSYLTWKCLSEAFGLTLACVKKLCDRHRLVQKYASMPVSRKKFRQQ